MKAFSQPRYEINYTNTYETIDEVFSDFSPISVYQMFLIVQYPQYRYRYDSFFHNNHPLQIKQYQEIDRIFLEDKMYLTHEEYFKSQIPIFSYKNLEHLAKLFENSLREWFKKGKTDNKNKFKIGATFNVQNIQKFIFNIISPEIIFCKSFEEVGCAMAENITSETITHFFDVRDEQHISECVYGFQTYIKKQMKNLYMLGVSEREFLCCDFSFIKLKPVAVHALFSEIFSERQLQKHIAQLKKSKDEIILPRYIEYRSGDASKDKDFKNLKKNPLLVLIAHNCGVRPDVICKMLNGTRISREATRDVYLYVFA